MMKTYFAPSTYGFYQQSFNSNIPSDAIVITQDTYRQLALTPLPDGFSIGLDAVGYPVLVPAIPNLESLHAQKSELINRSCESAITAGFWSDALGEPHQYGSQLGDQLNLTGTIQAGLDSLYPCRDEAGVKDFRSHTFAQIRQVGDDFTAFKLQILQKANQLKKRLDQALVDLDLATLESLTWESES